MEVLVYRNKHQGKTVDYSSMVGHTYEVAHETKTTYVLRSNEKYPKFVTTVPKRDCKKIKV